MIKLYDINETRFLNNGLCNMIPLKCIETKKKSLNGWYVDVELPVKYEQYLLKDRIILVDTKEKGAQPFRIGNITKKDRKVSFTANHIVFDAERYLLDDVRPTNLAPVSFLKWINDRTDNTSPFNVTSNVSGTATSYLIRKTLLEGFEKAEEMFGGVFDADGYNISLLNRTGVDEGFSIIYGKNLQGISIIEDWSSVCTKVLPVGPGELLLPEKYVLSDVQYDVPYTKTITFDFDTSYEDDEGNVIDYSLEYKTNMLREFAKDYLETNSVPLISYVVNSDVNQNLRIGDNIHVKHPFVDIITEVQEYTYNCLTKRVKSITFGNYERDVKKIFNDFKNTVSESSEKISNILKTISEQTDLINRLNKEGYVYIDDNEILILDDLPKEKAQQVWRFGLGGIGFSSTGYKGPFVYALTQDGHFNADFIQANSITVNHLAADVGSSLDISSNESIKSLVNKIDKTIEEIDTSRFTYELQNDGTSITNNGNVTLSAHVFNKGEDVTNDIQNIAFNWIRQSNDIEGDTEWNNEHKGIKSITLTPEDVYVSGVFYCQIAMSFGVQRTQAMTINDETDIADLKNSYLDPSGTGLVQELNDTTYFPDWTTTHAVLTPCVVDGILSIDIGQCAITYKRIKNGTEVVLGNGETVENGVLTISKNIMTKDKTSLDYVCYVSYKNSTIKLYRSYMLNVLGQDGTKGKDGTNGVSVVSVTSYFALSSSNTIPPTSGWITAQQNRPIGQFQWRKDVTKYSDNSSTETPPYLITGDKGDTGKGISGTPEVTYQAGTSGTIVPTGTWSSSVPTVTPGQYLWTKTVTKYTDGTSTTGYSVAYIPTNGATGKGVASITPQWYVSTSKTAQTGGSWVETMPTWSTGKYLWKRFKIVYQNPTSTTYTNPECDSSWEAVNDIQVGGRNLLLKSQNGYDFNGSDTSNVTSVSKNLITTKATGSGNAYCWVQNKIANGINEINNMIGESFSFSVDVKITGSFTNLRASFDLRDALNVKQINIVTNSLNDPSVDTWIRISGHSILRDYTTSTRALLCFAWSNSSAGSTIEYRKVKFEKGNIATDWSPAPEDQENIIKSDTEPEDKTKMWFDTTSNLLKYWDGESWEVTNDYAEDLNNVRTEITTEYNSAIEQLKSSITSLVEELQTTTTDNSQAVNRLASQIEQNASSISFITSSVNSIVDNISGLATKEEISKWARFMDGVLELGASNSPFAVKLSNTELGFYQNGTRIAYLSNQMLNISQAVVMTKLKFTHFEINDVTIEKYNHLILK